MLVVAALSGSGCCRVLGALSDSTTDKFDGRYTTNWGDCTLSQNGIVVSGVCARGTAITCAAVGKTLTCDWTEKTGRGKATLSKTSTGALVGTWGKGASSTDGGPWTFTPKQ